MGAGDFVDRGAWGLEVLLLLVAWPLALPQSVTLLRGNHEGSTCTAAYGFKRELQAKYSEWDAVYKTALKCFAALPLAAVIAGERTSFPADHVHGQCCLKHQQAAFHTFAAGVSMRC